MYISKLAAWGVALGAIFFACATAAQAEFKSTAKTTSGKTQLFVAQVLDGGAKINCAETENTGNPEWEVEKESKASEKGPALHLKFKKWGKCTTLVAGVSKSTESNECELETDQPKEEEKVPMTVVSTCSFKAEGCEAKIEPKENSERKWASVAYSGAEDENLSLEFEVTGITITVSGTCESLGVKATHEATLKGAIDAQQVAPGGPPASEFRLLFPPGTVPFITRVGNRVEVLLGNAQSSPVSGPGVARFTTGEPGWFAAAAFSVASKTVAECATLMFGSNATCGMKAEYSRATLPTAVYLEFVVNRPGGGVESRLAVGGQN